MKKLYLIITTILLLLPISISAKEKVDLYLFHSETCSHCQGEIKYLHELEKEYDNLELHLYEINNSKKNTELMIEIKEKLDIDSPNVPFTVIGNYYYIGYSEGIKEGIKELIDKYTEEKQIDVIKPILEGKEVPNVEILNGEIKTINIFGKNINPAKLSLPVLSIVLGAIDGFNPCAMWILIFLISMLFNMKDKKKMWCLGLIFLFTSAFVYLLFMFAWLGITTTLLTKVIWFRIIIALIALIGAYVNLKSFYNSIKKGSGCQVVDDKKRKKIFAKIKKFTSEKSLLLASLGIITLAVSVNIVELACSAGLPVLFTNILAINNVNTVSTNFYMFLYIFCFMLDDLIVFIIAMITLKVTGITTKYTKYTHLIGGIIMLLIGLLLIFKPEWIMFNF